MSSSVAESTLTNLLYTKKDGIAYVTLNRPKVLNALNRKTWEELRAVFEEVQRDPEVRGAILTGGCGKAFIAGADIGELAHVTAVEAEKQSSFGQSVLNLVENLGKPVVAAINKVRRAWRWLRDGHGLHDPRGRRACQVRSARGQAGHPSPAEVARNVCHDS